MCEASWLLLGSCLGSRRAFLWREKYLLSLHSCHITSFIPDSRAQGSAWIANYWLLASFQLIWPQCKDVRCQFALWDGAVELLWARCISRSVREELMYDGNAGMLYHGLRVRVRPWKVVSLSLGPAGIVGGVSECTALSSPSIPRLRSPWACHRTPNCSPGAAAETTAHCSGCVFMVCVFTLCVCACALGWVNAEYEFRVWVSKLGCMSRHCHSDRKKTERSHFTLAFPNSTWTHFYKWWTKSIQEFTEQKYLTNRWLIHKRKIIPVLFILPLFIYFHSIY